MTDWEQDRSKDRLLDQPSNLLLLTIGDGAITITAKIGCRSHPKDPDAFRGKNMVNDLKSK